MDVQVREDGPTRRVLELTVPPEEVGRHLDRVADEFQRRATLPGFRRGRVPRSLLEARYGGSLQEEALESAVEEAYEQALREKELTPVGSPRIEDVRYRPGDALRFRVVLEVRAPVEAKDYRGIALVRRVREVPEEEVASALERIREESAVRTAVDRAAEAGDVVAVDHVRIDEKGRTLKGTRVRDAELTLSEPGLLPEFREALIGARAGEGRTLQVRYPEDFSNPDLAGRSARFHLKVKKILEKKLRDLDDNLARELFQLGSLEELRSRIRLQLEGEERLRARRQLEEQLVEELLRRNTVPVPEGLVARLAEDALTRTVGETRIPDEERESLSGRFRQAMERRVAREWLLEAIARQEGIEVAEDELAEELSQIAQARGRAGAEFRALPAAQRRERVRDVLLERKIFDFLLGASEVKEEKAAESRLVVPA